VRRTLLHLPMLESFISSHVTEYSNSTAFQGSVSIMSLDFGSL
jgi:hypothetical protein